MVIKRRSHCKRRRSQAEPGNEIKLLRRVLRARELELPSGDVTRMRD